MNQLAEIAILLEMDEKELSLESSLESLSAWNSIAVIGFIAMADESYGVAISPGRLRKASVAAHGEHENMRREVSPEKRTP